MRIVLRATAVAHTVFGTKVFQVVADAARGLSAGRMPRWNPQLPTAADRLPRNGALTPGGPRVVYFPTCINRTFGVTPAEGSVPSLSTVALRLCRKAGYTVVFPERMDELCCGMAFASKGYRAEGDRKARELEAALNSVSEGGRLPILVDMSPCLYRMKDTFVSSLPLFEPVRFALDHLVPRLTIRRLPVTVAVHSTCSSDKMGLAESLRSLAARCAERVVVPDGVGCCGWAGDRGFTYPELNASALRNLKAGLPNECTRGYSTSRTCEIGLAQHGGIPYQSVLYLLDECSVRLEEGI
jgi:D-lactate dehydrogenase